MMMMDFFNSNNAIVVLEQLVQDPANQLVVGIKNRT